MKSAVTSRYAPALLASLSLCLALSPAFAGAPMVKTQAPGFYRLMLGEFEVTALSDGIMALPIGKFLTHTTPAEIDRSLGRDFLQEPVDTSINAYLVNTGSKLVLIDTGVGNGMVPEGGKLIASLTASGYKPEQIDEIYITHMHGDHIGGLSVDGQRVFPNATVRASRLEAEYWLSPEHLAAASGDAKGGFQGAHDALEPYVKAGAFSPFEDGAQLTAGVRAVATHGHTPGHTSYMIESAGQRMLVLGDLIHCGAVQFPNPTVTIQYDKDSHAALAQRLRVFHEAAADGYWIAAAHLSFPGIGHLRVEGKGYAFVPVNYGLPH